MLNLSEYPRNLQLLMKTDGTVTELIELLVNERLTVVKIEESINNNILYRRILLQGEESHIPWVYAESMIYLAHLPQLFVNDLLNHAIPIGRLWQKYRLETFKKMITRNQKKINREFAMLLKLPTNTAVLTREYQVFNQQKVIMEISEWFPIERLGQNIE